MIDKRDSLAEYQDERIRITGVFDKFGLITVNYRLVRTALLQDVYAHVDGKDLDIGHLWLQNADQLKSLSLAFGDRIKCNCRVKTYKKRLTVPNRDGLMVENRISLCWPTEIEVISRLQSSEMQNAELPTGLTNHVAPLKASAPLPPSTEEKEPISPAKMILEVRRLAKMAGGMDSLHQLVEALRSEA